MSVQTLKKAVSLCKEVAEQSDYYGLSGYSDEENEQSILFIYDMLMNQGEAATLKWLYDNGFLQ